MRSRLKFVFWVYRNFKGLLAHTFDCFSGKSGNLLGIIKKVWVFWERIFIYTQETIFERL